MDLTTLRAAATVACFLVFLGILVWTFSRRNAKRFEEDARIPFQQD